MLTKQSLKLIKTKNQSPRVWGCARGNALGERGARSRAGRAEATRAALRHAQGPHTGSHAAEATGPRARGLGDRAAGAEGRGAAAHRGHGEGATRRGRAAGGATLPGAARRGRAAGEPRAREKKVRGRGRERGRGKGKLTSGSKSGDHRLQNLGHHGEREMGEEVAAWEKPNEKEVRGGGRTHGGGAGAPVARGPS
jgi:hypothetical protein